MNKDVKVGKKGILPTLKSFWYGDTLDPSTYRGPITTQTFFQRITGTHIFNTYALKHLVDSGYRNNPIGFGIISKIVLSQRNIEFKPYWKGKPYVSKTIDFDINYALYNLITTGTAIIYFKEISVGFPKQATTLDTLRVCEEVDQYGNFTYKYDLPNGRQVTLNNDDLVIIPWQKIDTLCTQLGPSPLQAALMPIESLKMMYTADTSTLKNKGVDVLITNDSDDPIVGHDQKQFDDIINDRVGGARRSGRVATSTQKLRVLQLGRSAKELALWDGYKIKARDLCNALQVDSGLFNDPDNKTYANRQEAIRSMYNECVIPLSKLIVDDLQLIKKQGFEIYCDTSQIEALQETQASKADKAKTNIDMVTGLNASVKNGTITKDIAVRLLVSEAGYTEEEAVALIQDSTSGNNPIEPTT